ncbi:MAG: hypothetical protein HYU67_06765 [Flavobacteriia bacterium]|nr:hypothetical protein [Flavobacteriia bacterium]
MKEVFVVLNLLLIVLSCSKSEQKLVAKVKINFTHQLGSDYINFDPHTYTNEAGNMFTLTDLHYYISNITLFSNEFSDSIVDSQIHYLDLKKSETLFFELNDIPLGKYTSLHFDLGIDSARNVFAYLDNTIENQNMIWPEPMGGGYHFMKLEGRYLLNGSYYGYAFHLGKSKMRIHYELPLNKEIKNTSDKIEIVHDILEWFKNPLTYDLTIHEAYSMNNDSVMNVLKKNGQDVFYFKN